MKQLAIREVHRRLFSVLDREAVGNREGMRKAPANPALLFQRMLEEQDDSDKQARMRLMERIKASGGQTAELYQQAFERHRNSLYDARWVSMASDGAVLSGLGSKTSLEVGLRLHAVYGTPLIPGSSIKGVCAHYCTDTWRSDPAFQEGGEVYKVLFGSQEEAGLFVFHDAWIDPGDLNNCFVDDVMTVHHPKYYNQESPVAPTDFDDPNPVSFLGVRGRFWFAIECLGIGDDFQRWIELVARILTDALSQHGVGAKTRSGYGRFVPSSADAGNPEMEGRSGANSHLGSAARRYDVLDRVRVRRSEDHREQPWFETLNGTGGGRCLDLPVNVEIAVGEEVDLIVKNQNKPKGYNFSWPKPESRVGQIQRKPEGMEHKGRQNPYRGPRG